MPFISPATELEVEGAGIDGDGRDAAVLVATRSDLGLPITEAEDGPGVVVLGSLQHPVGAASPRMTHPAGKVNCVPAAVL